MGKKLALVDRTPGLTRDRREGITNYFDIPIRIVDTAGWEDVQGADEKELNSRSLNKKMLEDMLKQTRNALIYSDLALFVLDCRNGISYNDVALYKWLNYHRMRLASDKYLMKNIKQNLSKSDEEKYKEILEQEQKFWKNSKLETHEEGQSPEFDKGKFLLEKRKEEFQKQFKSIDDILMTQDVKVPEIIYLANKSEDGFEGDVLSDFYLQFPHAADLDPMSGKIIEPIFISAEHGDGLPTLFQEIKARIPETNFIQYQDRKQKRLERYEQYKKMLLDEILDTKKEETEAAQEEDIALIGNEIEEFARDWEREFENLNPNPEENSDFDSDNEINPLDTLTNSGQYRSSKKIQISTDNKMAKRPIQLSIVGRPNVGKSTLVNGLLKENRVIANDLPGTTRDSVMTTWVHNGRRINLVDTAGIKPNTAIKSKIDEMINEQVQNSINYSHVVIVLIDSMEAFTTSDMMVIKRVLDEGRGLVIAANKWDLVEDKYKKKATKWMEKQLEKGLGQASGIPLAYVSAKTGLRVDRIMDEVSRVYEKWNTRVSTGLLNKWLKAFTQVQKMPSEDGKVLKMRYLMQIKTRPPTFFLYVNSKNLVSQNFERFMRNSIALEFGFEGVPIRILLRDSRSQYAKKNLADMNIGTQKVLERIELHKQKMKNVTHRRRLSGSRFLYRQ